MTALEKLLAEITGKAERAGDVAIEMYPQAAMAIVAVIRKAMEALEKLGSESTEAWKSCGGTHSQYSSMHPNADTPCPKCGASQDGPGRSRSWHPRENSNAKREVLC